MTTWPAGISVTPAGHASRTQQADSLHSTRYALYMSDLSGSSPTLHLTAVVTQEGDWYVARCLEIDAVSQGETLDRALANLRDVVEVYLEEEGLPPAPTHPLVTSIDVPIPA
jgi:predicted RNase H-like HicB family nuclease